jgi:hypothetical protein
MPSTVAYSGSASVDGIFASGVGHDSRTGRRSTDSATSKIPGSRDPPPLSTMPARHASNMPLCRRVSRIISNNSRARGSRISATSRCGSKREGPVAHRRNLHFVPFGNQGDDRIAVHFLDLFRLGQRRAHPHDKSLVKWSPPTGITPV